MSKATFQAGLAAGIVSGMRFPMVVERPKKASSWYVYGGIPLPPLIEWNPSEWPYAIIFRQEVNGETYYSLTLLKKRPEYGTSYDGTTTVFIYFTKGETFYARRYLTNLDYTDKWVYMDDITEPNNDYDGHWVYVDGVLWTNTDIANTDSGGVYLAKFDPIPLADGTWAYSGVRLPKLPDWDKTKYPCAIIQRKWGDLYYLYLSTSQVYVAKSTVTGVRHLYGLKGCPTWKATYGDNKRCWEYYKEFLYDDQRAQNTDPNSDGFVLWSNYNLMDTTSNSTYRAASEPLPVYV
jgi:hypothetical protein